ncbi:MAG: Squalene--hopene cyclase [Verrucomicrobiales bacterium]|nr:Squalene--hopene cyclase [Verrucomicrobiales bacterium]
MKTLLILTFAFLVAAEPLTDAQELFESKSDPITVSVDKMYTRGLQFLVRTQVAKLGLIEGAWGDQPYGSEPAVVGLSVVAMLAHGDDPMAGPYSVAIRHGLNYILKQANTQTGYIGRTMYNHGFCTLALAEAYGSVLDDRIGPALEKAVRLIVTSQGNNPFGAWRYSPESMDADTTVSGAQMVALFAARNAGIPVEDQAIQKGVQFFLKNQTADGGFAYTPGTSANAARSAIGCVVLALAKEKRSDAFKRAFAYLQKAPPDSSYHHYYLYYASQAFFHASPEGWQEWNRKNIKTLESAQNPDGSWEGQFGTTFSTAASLLSLALNYRYLPIYER